MFGFISKVVVKIMGGTRNERIIRAKMKVVTEQINPLEEKFRALSDADLPAASMALRERRANGESREAIMPEAFSMMREASRRARNHRQFDVQLAAGMVLDSGWIAEEATGEGKTIACYPAIFMAWIDGMHTHVVTTNDVLVQRDAEFAKPVFEMLGLSVGFIQSDMDPQTRQPMYACDVTYGTNSEFGFDYLRDNMKLSVAEQVQGPLGFVIVDEVDSILIDEARTPLIISGGAYGDVTRYKKVDTVARQVIEKNRSWDRLNRQVETMKRDIKALEGELSKVKSDKSNNDAISQAQANFDRALNAFNDAERTLTHETQYFEVELDKKSVHMTHEGVGLAQEIAGVGSFYVGANMEWPHLMDQSLRAHLVYEKDKEYIVRGDEVVIVDEFTGRLMEGRQWSDGLHQAVEAKERVRIKEETQTLATITLQNYFKLYKKLTGMTGTAMTEAGEFLKIYGLDVAAVTTHRPINRVDREDLIFGEVEAKYHAIAEEVRDVSRMGRPVLVGTTSIEKSELISNILTRRHGIDHQVLNGRVENAARENDIVAKAGTQHPIKQGSKEMVGTVTIATNMAGRGTDIKLGEGVVFAGCRVPDDDALRAMGFEPDPLFPEGVNKCCVACTQYALDSSCSQCFKPKRDESFPKRGRSECQENTPCGLHIVGTERHEARRIDNQLRGRAGRQGDPGSSRFFLSLRDDLMSIFAGDWTVKVLTWLGLQGDVAIENKRISKGIERAQKKVEERNFEIRKNLLDYDEVMDLQRKTFYKMRQNILEGKDLQGLVFRMIDDVLSEACEDYLKGEGRPYVRRCIAEWGRQTLQTPIRAEQIGSTDPDDQPQIESTLKQAAKDEAQATIALTLGEYMMEDADPKDWDLRGLSSWAMSRFSVTLSQSQLRKMDQETIEETLLAAACERIDALALVELGAMLDADFARNALAEWARAKFGLAIDNDDLPRDADAARDWLGEKTQDLYHRREIEYPIEHILDMTVAEAGTENIYACADLATWVNRKYHVSKSADDYQGRSLAEIHAELIALAKTWIDDDKMAPYVRESLGSAPSAEQAVAFCEEQFQTTVEPGVFEKADDVLARITEVGHEFLRREMTALERFVLLQILDSSWKDHLLGMDHLKGAIGLRGFAEQDPKVAYKREGGTMFDDMFANVRDKITDMVFKVRLTHEAQVNNVYQVSDMRHDEMGGYERFARDSADQQAAAEPQKIAQIVRNIPRVGRNDPCPCGSGKKFKKCCGKDS